MSDDTLIVAGAVFVLVGWIVLTEWGRRINRVRFVSPRELVVFALTYNVVGLSFVAWFAFLCWEGCNPPRRAPPPPPPKPYVTFQIPA